MPDWVVTTAFRGKDEMSSAFKKAGKSADIFGKRATRSIRKVSTQALSLRKIMGGVLGAAAIQRSLGLLRQGVGAVITEFSDFDDAITAASAKFGIFNKESEEFMNLKKTARDVGATTEFTAAQAAEGLRFLAKAGWEANASMKALPAMVDLATASEMEFSRAADIATDVMGAFGLKSQDAEENLKQLIRVNDVMSKAVNMANVDMEDLFETMKFAGPIAKTAGVSLEKFSAIAAFVGGAGIKASMSGTAMRTMFLNLAAPTGKATKKFKEFGIELQDAEGNLRDPIQVMKEMSGALKDMGTAQRAAALNLIFGKRAVSGASVSVDGATKSLQEFEEALKNSHGNSEKLAAFMRTSFKKRMAELKSAALDLGLKFIDAFEKKIPGGFDAMIKKIREIDMDKVTENVKTFGTTVINVIKETRSFIEDYKGLFIGLGAAIAAVKLLPLVTAIGGFVVTVKAAIAGGAGFSAAILGTINPIGLAIVAIGGLTAGIATLILNWDDLGRAIKWGAQDIFGYLSDLRMNAFNPLVQIPNIIFNEWNRVPAFFNKIGKEILNGMINFTGIITEIFLHPIDLIKTMLGYAQKAAAFLGIGKRTGAVKTIDQQKKASPGNFDIPPSFQIPPSQTERQSKQAISFEGNMTFANAPKGSKIETKTKGAPPIKTEMLGAS